MVIGIKSYGAYIPKYYVERVEIAHEWDFPSIPGAKAFANGDEDSLSMACDAGIDCLEGIDPKSIDGLFFASTTPPYAEKENASVLAVMLDLRKNIICGDFCNSMRGATAAICRAFDTIKAGSAKNILVVAADMRAPVPESMFEYTMGDGAAAVLIGEGADVGIEIKGYTTVSDNVIGPWRRSSDKYVRDFEMKHENIFGYSANLAEAVKQLVKKYSVDVKKVGKAVIFGPDPRTMARLGKTMGFSGRAIKDDLFMVISNTGTPYVLMLLISQLRRVKDKEEIVVGGYGDGADAIYMVVASKEKTMALKETHRGVNAFKNTMEKARSYGQYLAARKLLEKERFTRRSSPVTYWREEPAILRWYGGKCKKCGAMQYLAMKRGCIECHHIEPLELVKLQRKGKIFTYTLDHLVGGEYQDTPVPRCVIDLDGGARVLLDMTDCDPKQVAIGMEVEMTMRLMHEGANFKNYYWKCRPIRKPAAGGEEDESKPKPEMAEVDVGGM